MSGAETNCRSTIHHPRRLACIACRLQAGSCVSGKVMPEILDVKNCSAYLMVTYPEAA